MCVHSKDWAVAGFQHGEGVVVAVEVLSMQASTKEEDRKTTRIGPGVMKKYSLAFNQLKQS